MIRRWLAPLPFLLAFYVIAGAHIIIGCLTILCLAGAATGYLLCCLASRLEAQVTGYLASFTGPERGQPVRYEKSNT